jgi:hypothetical protein
MARENRVRRVLLVMTHAREVAERVRLKREAIERLTVLSLAVAPPNNVALSIVFDGVDTPVLLLFVTCEAERSEKRVAEADIDKPLLLKLDKQQQVVEWRSEAAVSMPYARREQGDVKAECAEQVREETVQFIAEAAASVLHDLLVESGLIEYNRASHGNVEILEWDGELVRLVQGR